VIDVVGDLRDAIAYPDSPDSAEVKVRQGLLRRAIMRIRELEALQMCANLHELPHEGKDQSSGLSLRKA
jgi:hypothetical protein